MVSCDETRIELVPIIKEKNGIQEESVTFVEQYVKEVCDFSSQYGSNISISYTAYNIAGNPSKFPDYGDYPQAFVMFIDNISETKRDRAILQEFFIVAFKILYKKGSMQKPPISTSFQDNDQKRTYGKWWNEAPSKLSDFMPQNNEPIVSQDYIDVEYHKEVYPIRVSIYETYNPGSVVRIWARASSGHWHQLWSGPPQKVPHKPRIFSPPLALCSFKTKMLRLEFNHSYLDYYTELDAILLIGTTELILPHFGFQNRSLSALLQQLGGTGCNNDDVHNLTPEHAKANCDLRKLKSTLYKHCVLYKSRLMEKLPKGKLLTKLGLHCHLIPPIEEAFNSLQQFLQEDFPELIKEINLSSSSTVSSLQPQIKSSGSKDLIDDTCGSFSVLPDETVLKIFKNLDLKSLCRCCRVNKHFNNIARDALLYTSLNLKPYWNYLDSGALNYLAGRCKYLQKIDFSWCGNYNTITPENIIEFLNLRGNLLTHLRLNCCRFVNDLVIKEISRVCKNLKELCLRNCTRITAQGFEELEKLKALERLELYRTAIETPALCSILKNNRQMRHLNLAGMHERLNMDEVAIEVANSCQFLESIDFWKAQTLTPTGVRALTRCTTLREVDFGWCGGMGAPGDSLRTFLTCCSSLEKVFLGALRGLTERDIEPLLLCHRLQQLDLLGARSLTPDICLRFLLCCPELKMMDLSFCDGISDSKIQEWRQLYPHVSIKRSFQVSSLDFMGDLPHS